MIGGVSLAADGFSGRAEPTQNCLALVVSPSPFVLDGLRGMTDIVLI